MVRDDSRSLASLAAHAHTIQSKVATAERTVREAKQTEGPNFPISMRSLQLWHGAYYRTGADGRIRGVEGLVDRRGVEDQGDGKSTDARDPQAVEYFYEQFHCQSKLTVKTCHDMTFRRAKQKGWSWPASYSAVRKWLQIHDDLSLTCLLREGRDAWQHRYMPHIEVDHSLDRSRIAVRVRPRAVRSATL